MASDYLAGSEWRKWDLHVHTPASFHWGADGNGQNLKDMSDEQKATALKTFVEGVNDSDVEVFAVQDYWTFDWVFALRDYLKDKDDLKKVVLPGMELRVECPVNYRLNVHVVLSDQLTKQQLTDFKSELKIRFSGDNQRNLSDEAIIDFARTLDAGKAGKHGFADPTTLGDDDLLKLGSMTVEVTKDSLLKAINGLPANTGFILLPYDTSDGLLKLDWSKHPLDDNYFMQTAHIFESRDQRNVDLFNGRKTEANGAFSSITS